MKLCSLTLTTEVLNALSLDQRIRLIQLEKRAPCFLYKRDYLFLAEVEEILRDKGILEDE